MKKLFTLCTILTLMVSNLCAADYDWKEVKSSMTTIPDNFYAGLTRDDARDYMNYDMMAEGTVYGNLPGEDGKMNVLYLNEDYDMTDGTMTWEEILESGLMFYYPAAEGEVSKSLELNCSSYYTEITSLYESGAVYENVTLNRTMSRFLADGVTPCWNTAALPFAMTAEQIATVFGANAKVVKLSKIDGDVFYFESATEIEEECLYLVQLGNLSEDLTSISLQNVKMSSIYNKFDVDYTVVATIYNEYVDNMLYQNFVVYENGLVSAAEREGDLQATSFYIQAKDGLDLTGRTLTLDIEGSTTGIKAADFNAGRIPASTKRIDGGIVTIVKDGKSFNAAGQNLK